MIYKKVTCYINRTLFHLLVVAVVFKEPRTVVHFSDHHDEYGDQRLVYAAEHVLKKTGCYLKIYYK